MSAGRSPSRSRRFWALLTAVLAILSLLLVAPRATAGPGDLDGSFNGSGMVTRDWGGTDEVRGLAVQPDGMIVAAGVTSVVNNGEVLFRFAVARFYADGSPDDGFGDRGVAVIDINGGDSTANAVAVMADGRIVVAGSTGADPYEVALVRLTPEGQLDGSFGQGGIVTDSWSDGSDQPRAVAVTESGRVVVGGLASRRRVVARYTPDGGRDGAFGVDGLAMGVALPGNAPPPALALDARADAATVLLYAVGGGVRSTWQAPSEPGASLTPLGGEVSLAGGLDRVSAVAVGSGGMMLVAGVRDGRFAVAAHQFDGALLPVFAGGVAVTDFRTETQAANAVAIQPDGRVLVAGQAAYDAALARYDGIPRPATPDQTPTPEPAIPATATERPSTPQPTPTPEPTIPATTVPTRTPPASTGGRPDKGTVLFSEDFNSAAANRIPLTTTDTARYRRTLVNGELQLVSAASPNFVDSVNIPGDYSDLTVAMDVRLVGDTTQRFFMVTCRSTDRGEYRLLIEPARQRVRIVVNVRGGSSTDVRDVTGSSAVVAGNGTNHIELTCAGALLTARINGREVASVADSTFTSGRSWFATNAYLGITSSTEARVDNIVITQE